MLHSAAATPEIRVPQGTLELQSSIGQKIAFFLLCVYLISNLANDWSLRFFGNRAYLSLISGVALPIACLIGGHLFRGLQVSTGRWWLAFMVWMALTILTSTWRNGSLGVVQEFATKNYPIFFYCTACVMTFSQMRKLLHVMAVGGVVVLLSCYFFGDSSSGRLMIPDSIFFDNSNDLALQLLTNVGFFTVWITSKKWTLKWLGILLTILSLVYMLQTGSRANFLSLAACIVVALFLVRQKLLLVGMLIAVTSLGALTISSQQWSRLVYIVLSPDEVDASADGDLQSQIQRNEMLKASLRFTASNPVFGIGPGQFPEQVWSTANRVGKRVASLGTHNTYTQVSSESGIPAFLCYVAVLFGSLRLMLRLYKRSIRLPEQQEIAYLALSLILILVVYSVSTVFHHVAYSRHLPTLAGMSITLHLIAARMQTQSRGAAAVKTR